MCVEERGWIPSEDFEDAVAATNLLPGPASTQLAIYCAWRLKGTMGGLLGGICFIVPGLVLALVLARVFLERGAPVWVIGAAAGAGAAVPAVALVAARNLFPASWRRMGKSTAARVRWIVYAVAGGVAVLTIGQYLVLVIVGCGMVEIALNHPRTGTQLRSAAFATTLAGHATPIGGLLALAWVALKVGALSYGGGFVIVPLMQHDAVVTYHWLTGTQFLNAVAIGQITPGPVVVTTAVVGYAAKGIRGGLIAAAIAFAPSFVFVLFGAGRFDRLRRNEAIQAFLTGAGPTVIGAIAGSSIALGTELHLVWQVPILAGGLVWLLLLRRGVVTSLVAGGVVGVLLAVAGVAV